MEVKAFTKSGIKRYFHNTSWLMGGHTFRMAVNMAVTIAMARYLGPQEFGRLNFVLAITLLLGVLANLGLDKRLKKELAERPDRRDVTMGTYVVLTLAASLFVYLMMALVIVTGTGDPANLSLYLWLGAVFLFSPLRCTEIWFQTQVRSQLTVIAGSAGVILSAILKIYLILTGAALPLFAAAIFLETLITIILLLGFYRKKVGTFTDWTIDWKLSRQLLSDSWPLLLSGIAVTVYMQIDQVMLGLLLDEEAVGHYSAAIRISTVWYFIPMMLATSLFPAIVQARADSEAQYRSRLRQYFELNAFVAYLITVPLAIGAYWLVPLLFGQSYGQASLILSVHIWSLLFVFLGVARSEALLVEEQYRFVMISTLSGAVLNIVLNLLLIPSLGGVGAAVATLVAQGFASVGACFAYSPVRPIGLALVKAAVFPFSFISDLTRRQ